MSAWRPFQRSSIASTRRSASARPDFAPTVFAPTRQGLSFAALRPAGALLVDFARYHRDRRNIAGHFVGIPMVVFGLAALLGRLQLMQVNLAWLLWGLSALWYLTRGKPSLGLLTAGLTAATVAVAQPIAMSADWLFWGVGSLAAGWAVQSLGHYFEGRRAGFVDDLVGQLVGPMFLVAEALITLGLERETRIEIELGAGSTHVRDLSLPSPPSL
jgi:uncharacterized membrane protein YGL010W